VSLVKEPVAEKDIIEPRISNFADGVLRRADIGLAMQVERGVEDAADPGPLLE